MSDFLGRLVGRSLVPTGSVHPQLLSIFEPPAQNGARLSHEIESPSLPAVEQPRPESSDRSSRLQSLWHPPPESSRQFATTSSKPGSVASAQSAVWPDVSSHFQPHIDAPAKQPSENAVRDEESARASPTQFLSIESQARRRADVPLKQQSEAAPKEFRGAADTSKTNQDGVDSSGPVLASGSQRIRPRATPKEQSEPLPAGRHGSPDAAVASERGGNASRPEPLRASTEIRPPVELPVPAIHPRPTALITPSTSEPVPVSATRTSSRALRPEKVMELKPVERESHRRLTSGRDVHAISPRPVSQRFHAPAQQAGSPPVTPTINVTIGRIEVRATPPPRAPEPAPRTPAPVMSLDEYLRQRAGGNRR